MSDISMQNFETDLIKASQEQPILLDIWAPWCGPCKALGPMLEKLEVAYAGRFKLAKLNSDDQPEIAGQLSQMFGVRSIPFCVLFKGGQPVDGFVGALPEAQIREFLDKHVASADEAAAEDDIEAARALLTEGDPEAALARLKEALALSPTNDTARYDLLRALIGRGHLDEARGVFDEVASTYALDPRLVACGHWLSACEKAAVARPPAAIDAALATNKRDFDARFERAQVHFAAQQFTQAMDELLEIMMRDKTWHDELARKTYVAILELMQKPKPVKAEAAAKGTLELSGKQAVIPSDPLIDTYRRRLSMVVF